jgi:hypothetical protein
MVPSRLFNPRFRILSFERLARVEGIVPISLFELKFKNVSSVREVMELGRDPLIASVFKRIRLMTPEEHCTPVKPH